MPVRIYSEDYVIDVDFNINRISNISSDKYPELESFKEKIKLKSSLSSEDKDKKS